MKRVQRIMQWWTTLFLALLVLGACGAREQAVPPPLAIGESPEPGLAVYYKNAFYRHIANMASDQSMIKEGKVGQPVSSLDHRFTESVFDSGRPKGVGVLLTGYLKMAVPGEYRFQAMSNDGIRVTVNGQQVILDPTVHSDRLSKVGQLAVEKPGWYSISVKYFQRKGTARLELYWQPPGVEGFEVIPAAVYGHLPVAAR